MCIRDSKTSALTRIEYAPQNQLKVEYVTPEEWTALRRLASSPMQTPQVRAAREAVELARERGTPVQDCLAAKSETFSFSSYAELNRKLDESVGDTGILTPIVKYVTLGLSLERLENLSVIDTPGLNDPVYSRTEKNRRFIELCDAAFFLSRCGSFLDQNDLALLTMYLPGKGLGSLTLIASQEVLMINTAAAETVFFFDRTSKSLSPVYYSAAKRLHIMYGSFGCPLFCWYVQSASHLADSSPAQ